MTLPTRGRSSYVVTSAMHASRSHCNQAESHLPPTCNHCRNLSRAALRRHDFHWSHRRGGTSL
ncbi:hypothetical protein DEO72_LG10g1535 [Vigna unguiculata]|uniref:Uncharacterized protein n=1 Tax=Vigna unguiculata TaxID=3917 RepID=A0A4D6NEH9_VIGUN|nr:hypothetical protein DEO72_LG10g1535 [Vigna unguiculata]